MILTYSIIEPFVLFCNVQGDCVYGFPVMYAYEHSLKNQQLIYILYNMMSVQTRESQQSQGNQRVKTLDF